MVSIIIFILLLSGATAWFTINALKVRRNILLGKPVDRTDRPAERWKTMVLVALGQKKMFAKPIPALLHLFLYSAFVSAMAWPAKVQDSATVSMRSLCFIWNPLKAWKDTLNRQGLFNSAQRNWLGFFCARP